MIKQLGKEMDPVLQDILLDGVTKYLTGTRQKKYIVNSSSTQQTDYWDRICQVQGDQERTTEGQEDEYWQLQRNQEAIGWDNLLQGKFVKDWRKLNGVHLRKQKAIRKQKEKLREEREKERDLYWDPMRTTKKKEKVPQKKKKQKSDVIQQVFESIMKIIREL